MSRYFTKFGLRTTFIVFTATLLIVAFAVSVKEPFDAQTFPNDAAVGCGTDSRQTGTACRKIKFPHRAELTFGTTGTVRACKHSRHESKEECIPKVVAPTLSADASLSTGIGGVRLPCKRGLMEFGTDCQSIVKRTRSTSDADQRTEDSFDRQFGAD